MIIKLLTFNIGLLDYNILGKTVFSNPKFSKERLQHIPKLLLKSDSDIICLQECYDLSHFKFIFRKIKFKYPFFARKNFKNKLFKLHNGLIIFSKFKIQNINLFIHNKSDIFEKLFGNKSFLVAEIVVNNYNLVIFNTHLTSGIIPYSQTSIYNRQTQLDEIFSVSDYYLGKGFIPLILGDFNFGPKTKSNG
jgi:endonuclease/exonuclease/phosphatase family metal-dependent hydrolase